MALITASMLTVGVGNARAACVGGAENGDPSQAGEQCDDGPDNPCCKSDCTPDATKKDVACNDYNDCSELSSCNNTGQCVGRKPLDGGACNLRNGLGARFDCVTRTCEGLSCAGAVQFDVCSDGEACTYDNGVYDAAAPNQCYCGTHVPLAANSFCDSDNNQCTVETCQAGHCTQQSTITCTQPSNTCRRKVCIQATGDCKLEDKPNGTACASDGKICSSDECRSGTCSHIWAQPSDPCDDGRYCTANDGCYALSPWTMVQATNQLDCFGNPFQLALTPCNDGNVCSSASMCDPAGGGAGNCVATACTGTGTCQSCQLACGPNPSGACSCAGTQNAAP